MAYNTNTRLLLQFDATGVLTDTSSFARGVTASPNVYSATGLDGYGGSSAYLGFDGLTSTGQIGEIYLTTPAALFASGSSIKRIEFWYSVSAEQVEGADGLCNFAFANGRNIEVITCSDGSIQVIADSGGVGVFIGTSPADDTNLYGTGWHHLRVLFSGPVCTIARDGVEVFTATHTVNLWGSDNLFQASFGQGQNYWSHLGNLDSIWLLEGDTGWTGGDYTVPTAKPDNYAGVSERFGIGGNTLESLASYGTGSAEVHGTGAAAVANLVSAGQGLVPPLYNQNTRLLLKFNESAGATTVSDTSAQARSATFSAGSVVSSPARVGNLAPVGNPGGAIAPSAVVVSSPAGVFSDGVVNRQFDLWYQMYWGGVPASSTQPLISIQFANGDSLFLTMSPSSVACEYNGTATDAAIYAYRSITAYPAANTWNHYRVAIVGNTLRIGLNGVELGSVTITPDIWTGSAQNLPVDVRFGLAPASWAADATYRAQGYLDTIEFTEGTITWAAGGNYVVPSGEPTDAPYVPPITGTGSNTLGACVSSGAGLVQAIRLGAGANLLDACIGSGEVVHNEHFGAGANVLDTIVSEGFAATGVIPQAVGANMLDAILSSGAGVLGLLSQGIGASTLDSVASAGTGWLNWAVATGNTALEAVGSTGTGSVANYVGPTGEGANVVVTASSGAATARVSGEGSATVSITSSGIASNAKIAEGNNTVAVGSVGTMLCETLGAGANTLQSMNSFGQIASPVFGAGATSCGVSSQGSGILLITGVGENTTDVHTFDDGAWRTSPSAVFRQFDVPLFVRTKTQCLSVFRP